MGDLTQPGVGGTPGDRTPSQTPTLVAGTRVAPHLAGPSPRSVLAAGQDFGPYRMKRLLGRGGMGEVYEAEERDTGRRLAVKVLAHSLTDTTARARFLREGRLAAAVSHPHTVYVFGTDEIEDYPVIAMELSEGGTLKDRVTAEGPLPPAKAVDAILQVISGLEAAAEAGVLHRDVKPSNCFVEMDGTVKVGDFGLSISTLAREESHLTATGSFLGTPAFASPEQLRGEPLDVRSDLYSVGATLFYLLTGRPPFEGENVFAIVSRVLSERPESPRRLRSAIPRGLSAIVVRCLAKRAADRFADQAALERALKPYASAAATPATLSIRFLAGLADLFLSALVSPGTYTGLLAGISDGQSERAFARPSVNFVELIGDALVFILYYGLSEGLWGASPGKAMLGLRVLGTNGRPIGLSRAVVRAVIFVATSLVTLLPIHPSIAGPLSTPGLLALFLCFPTARRRNGFAGIHELATGTRVVTVGASAASSRLRLRPAGSPNAVGEDTIGPYRVDAQSQSGIIEAYDPALRRRVWIYRAAIDAPPVAPARRDLSRPGRVRWLAGRRVGDESWDAYEAVDGEPLLTLTTSPRPWSEVRHWLRDLTRELRLGLEDGSLPPLGIDRVWIGSDGVARLLDWRAPGLSSGPGSHAPTPVLLPEAASVAPFLNSIASAALMGSVIDESHPSRPVLLPIAARAFLETLSGSREESIDSLQKSADDLAQRPPAVTWRLRAFHLFLLSIPWFVFTLGALFVMATKLHSEAAVAGYQEMDEGLRLLDGLVKSFATDDERAALLEYKRLGGADHEAVAHALRAYLVHNFRNQLQDPSFWDDPWHWEVAPFRSLAEPLVKERPSDEEALRAEELLTPFLEYAKRKGRVELVALLAILSSQPLLLVSVLGLLSSVCVPGGIGMRLLGIVVVDGSGKAASRLRCLARASMAFAPALVMSALAGILFMNSRVDVDRPLLIFVVPLLAAFALLLVGVVSTLRHPERALQDRLAGTYLVPLR